MLTFPFYPILVGLGNFNIYLFAKEFVDSMLYTKAVPPSSISGQGEVTLPVEL